MKPIVRASALAAAVSLAVAVSCLTAGHAFANHPDDKVAIDRGRYLKTVNQLLQDLEQLDDRNENNADKRDRRWIRERIAAMRNDLTGVRADLEAAPPVRLDVPPPAPPPPPPVAELPTAMSGPEFRELVGELKKQSFDKQRLALLKEVAKEAWFTTDQVIEAMSLFSFSSEKIAAGTAMYPHVVDRQSWYKVYSTLSFSSDQEKLRKQTSGR